MYMNPRDWLEIARKEYLQDFIRNGGAAVKFVVPTEEIDHNELMLNLRKVAEDEGYLFACIDAAIVKVHLIDQLFHEISRQVDWDELAFSFTARVLCDMGLRIPSERHELSLRKIAELNGREEMLLQNELNRLLEEKLFRDYQMCQEFRITMIRLCQAQLDPSGVSPVPSSVVKTWLRGELRRISELKPALIFQKVARHNAWHMLSSLTHWSHLAGKSGLVIGLDISRCLVQRRGPGKPDDSSQYYTRATALDAYEVLREFIDSTDEMEFCFVAVVAPSQFLAPDDPRGVEKYLALKLRIWDEVHDKMKANPLYSLIRLSPCPEVVAELQTRRV